MISVNFIETIVKGVSFPVAKSWDTHGVEQSLRTGHRG
jgi:hypothetical protein